MNRLSSSSWRSKVGLVLVVGLVLLLIVVVVSYITAQFKPTTQVTIGSGVYKLWVVDTEKGREQGLSGVKSLEPNGGLLMKFDTSDTWGIWMKDMEFPLDIVWLNENGKVVYIVEDAQPESPAQTVYLPKKDARYVVELMAGNVKRASIKEGSQARFEENGVMIQ
ncbi:MAG: DUF192 domain-containing protein [Candidatus Microsaccharimonas sp.]